LRYRGAAMAEFWRALKTLKALQAEAAREADAPRAAHPLRPAARPRLVERARPNEPETSAAPTPAPRLAYGLPDRPAPGALHEPAAARTPNEPESGAARHAHLNQPPIAKAPSTGRNARAASDPRLSRRS
jgi:hypothetical protein